MNDTQLRNTVAQTHLAEVGLYSGRIDGVWGPLSRAGAQTWLSKFRSDLLGSRRLTNHVAENIRSGTLPADHLATFIAQAYLEEYHGKLDCQWGPLSQAAARRWWDAGRDNTPATAGTQTPYDIARGYIGVQGIPGPEHHPKILQWLRSIATWVNSDETAWCAAFVEHCARSAGYESAHSLSARAWLNIGQTIPERSVRRGDVVIFWRGNPSSWTGHVGFVEAISGSAVHTLGGNQSNSVRISTYNKSTVLGYRRLRSLDTLEGNSSAVL